MAKNARQKSLWDAEPAAKSPSPSTPPVADAPAEPTPSGVQKPRSMEGLSSSLAGQAVELTPSEFDLLATLMGAPGRVFSRLELLDRLQGTAYEGYERTIDVHIRNLRTKIEPDPSKPRYIETVYGSGYRFSAHD